MKNSLKNIISLLLSFVVISYLVVACQSDDSSSASKDVILDESEDDLSVPESEFDMLSYLSKLYTNEINVIVSDFVSEVEVLNQYSLNFNSEKSIDNLLALQNQWKQVINVWKQVEIYSIGDVASTSLKLQIDQYPVEEEDIDGFVMGEEITEIDFVSSKGANVRGLVTIEYLLFSNELNNEDILATYTEEASFASNRSIYLEQAITDVLKDANEYKSSWDVYEATFQTETTNTVDGSQNLLINSVIALVEFIKTTQLGEPLDIANSSQNINPEDFESYHSSYSLNVIESQINGVDKILTGEYEVSEEDNLGVYDQLIDLDRQDLVSEISEQITLINANIAAIKEEGSIEEVALLNSELAIQLYVSVERLVALLKTDLSSALNIVVTFSDNDGDS